MTQNVSQECDKELNITVKSWKQTSYETTSVSAVQLLHDLQKRISSKFKRSHFYVDKVLKVT